VFGRAMLTARRKSSVIAVVRVEVIIHMAAEMVRPVEPGTYSDKDSAVKPLRPIVSIGSAIVGGHIIVTVGTVGSGANVDAYADLRLGFGAAEEQNAGSNK